MNINILRLSALLVLGPSSARAAVIGLQALPRASAPAVTLYGPQALPAPPVHAAIPTSALALSAPSLLPAAPALVNPVLAPPAAFSFLQASALSEMSLLPSAAAAFDGARRDADAPASAPDPAVDAFVKELLAVVIKVGAKAESEFIEVLARAQAAGLLAPVMQALVADPRVIPHLPPMPAEKRALFAAQFSFMIAAELEGAGRIPGTKPFESWDDMTRRQLALVAASAFAPRSPGEPSLFAASGFIKEYEALSASAFTDGNSAKILIDGPVSFAVRFALMRKAKKSIHIQSWAFYDDVTGNAAADLLIAKKREGLDVKIMVDGQTAVTHGAAVLARMAAAGVEIVFFKDASRRYDGLHAKIMLIDGMNAIVGGMNFGDDYSHMGTGQKWRDTDILYRGPVVSRTMRSMADLWNAQIEEQGLAHGRMSAEVPAVAARASARMAFLADGPKGEATIMLAYLKAISGASTIINIENAYLITMPALRAALLKALQRGVKVNILTNSAESIDEPIMTAPILASLPELIAAGARISLKRGSTLHSKFMTVDGLFSIVGSFNLHPRSMRYENEVIVSVLDARVAAALDRAFAADMAAASPATDPAALQIPDSPLTRIARRYLYNQL